MSIQPFKVKIPQDTLDDLQNRLARTRWPNSIEDMGWDYGTNRAYLQELVDYWQHHFDWRKQESMLNKCSHFRTNVDGFSIHFMYERGKGPNPRPLLLLHGWPDSCFRMYKLIPRLTDPARYGGSAHDSFDVIVPSLPGFGFSDQPSQKGFTHARVAHLLSQLMREELGYERFGVHGGDIGSSVTEAIAHLSAESLIGIHLTDIPSSHLFTVPQEQLSEAEQKYLEAGKQWQMTEGAYAMMQATKPQTLAYALNDSPVGLASWLVEKFRAWSDCDGDVEKRFTKDELLTNIMIYWATATINSSFLPYYEAQHNKMQAQDANGRVEVPTGVAIFPKDLVPAPREFGERFFNIQRWTEMPRGGHFAAIEEPVLLAEDIRQFFHDLR